MASIKPIGAHVVVKRSSPKETSVGGIILPENAKEKPQEGSVIAIGSGKILENGERSSFTVSTGDRVIFTSYAGTEIAHDGEDYLVMQESDILAIVK
jgi:chaperonin GroES